MITSLTIENFKAHRSTTIQLGRLTVLVGPNGSGKTSVLQALGLLGKLVTQRAESVFQGAADPWVIARKSAATAVRVAASGSFAGRAWRASFALTPADPAPSGTMPLNVLCAWTPTEGEDGQASGPTARIGAGLGGSFWASLGSARMFRFDARLVAAPSYSNEEQPSIDDVGSNTAAVLAATKLSDDDRFKTIVEALQKLVPGIKRVRIKPARTVAPLRGSFIEVMGYQVIFDFEDAADVSATAVSDGTLVSLALLTMLFSEQRPGLVLLDDIEQGLHPTAQVALMQQLARTLELFPDLQIIATTHSPFILDGVSPEQVLVFFRRDDGEVVVRPLSDHPDAQKAKGTLSAGQIWTLDPESWVVSPEAAE